MSILYVHLTQDVEAPEPEYLRKSPLELLHYLWENRRQSHVLWLRGCSSRLILQDESLVLRTEERPDQRVLSRYLDLLRKQSRGVEVSLQPLVHFLDWWLEVEKPEVILTLFESWRAETDFERPVPALLDYAAKLYEGSGRPTEAERLHREIESCLPESEGFSSKQDVADSLRLTRLKREQTGKTLDSRIIEIDCFGPLRIRVAGRRVCDEAWRTRKALSLFLYLALEKAEASASQLQEVIWPGRGPENKRNLQTTISRIRKTLSRAGWKGTLNRSRGGLYSLEPRLVRSSKTEFETKAARFTAERHSSSQAHQVIDLHQGLFLEGMEDLWVTNRRRHYLRLWFSLVSSLLEDLLSKGHFSKAENLSSRMLSFDGASEQAHLAKIKTLFYQRRLSEAVAAYKLFKRVLLRSTGMPPSAEALDSFRRWKRQFGSK